MRRNQLSRERLWIPRASLHHQMSLLEYFKRKEPFPDPTGPLARVLPASEIIVAHLDVQ